MNKSQVPSQEHSPGSAENDNSYSAEERKLDEDLYMSDIVESEFSSSDISNRESKVVFLKYRFPSLLCKTMYKKFLRKQFKEEVEGKKISLYFRNSADVLTIKGPKLYAYQAEQRLKELMNQIKSVNYTVDIFTKYANRIRSNLAKKENESFFLQYFGKIYEDFPEVLMQNQVKTTTWDRYSEDIRLDIQIVYKDSENLSQITKILDKVFRNLDSKPINLRSELSEFLKQAKITVEDFKAHHFVIVDEFFDPNIKKWRLFLNGERKNMDNAQRIIKNLENGVKYTQEKIEIQSEFRDLLKSKFRDLSSQGILMRFFKDYVTVFGEVLKVKNAQKDIQVWLEQQKIEKEKRFPGSKRSQELECKQLDFGLLDPYVQGLNHSESQITWYGLPPLEISRIKKFALTSEDIFIGRKQYVAIKFVSKNEDRHSIKFSLKECETVYYEENLNNEATLYFQLKYNPFYHKKTSSSATGEASEYGFGSEFTKEPLFADYLSRSMVYKVLFVKSKLSEGLKGWLKELNVKRPTKPIKMVSLDRFPYLTYSILEDPRLNFDIRYALLACITHKKASLYEITPEFMEKLQKLEANIVKKTLEDLALKPQIPTHLSDGYLKKSFVELFDNRYDENKTSRSLWENVKSPSQMITIKRVTITPSLITYSIGRPGLSNAVVGRFRDYEHCFLRVTFADEDGERPVGTTESERKRFRKHLDGLKILEKTFQFLACSASQLKRCSAWMFCEDEGKTVEEIHQEMGDFSNINTPSKYGARLGQLFSQSIMSLEIKNLKVERLLDIETKDGKVFSDGIGTISSNILRYVQRRFNLTGKISAIQIRNCGYKGMLVEDSKLEDDTIRVRKSMEKFSSTFNKNVLEVLDYSRFAPACLNRQIILLLLANGIPETVFEDLKNKAIQDLTEEKLSRNMLSYINNENALVPTKPLLMNCVNQKINITKEPFLRRVVETIKIRSFMQVKDCSFVIDEAATLFGTIDEKDTLASDEVFICISRSDGMDKSDFQVISGNVMVTKFPCLFRGDISVLKAIDKPEVREKFKDKVNCIIFPAKGDRPRTDEISGSDLDGDKYFVCWDETLIPAPQNRGKPMSFEAKLPKEKSRVTLDDAKDFMFEFLQNDKLAKIALSHMALADGYLGENLPRGIIGLSKECDEHGEEHSIAVDYAKNGTPSQMNRGFARKWPDYLNRHESVSYESKLILGKVYREIKSRLPEIKLNNVAVKTLHKEGLQGLSEPVLIDELIIIEGFQNYLCIAFKAIKIFYDKSLAFMDSYGIRTEYEIYSGCFLKFNKRNRYKRYGAIEKLQEKAIAHIESIKHFVGNMLLDNFEEKIEDESIKGLILQIASAVYIATYYLFNEKENMHPVISTAMKEINYETDIKPKFEDYKIQLLGLPWYLFQNVLIELKSKQENAL